MRKNWEGQASYLDVGVGDDVLFETPMPTPKPVARRIVADNTEMVIICLFRDTRTSSHDNSGFVDFESTSFSDLSPMGIGIGEQVRCSPSSLTR